MRRRKPDWGQRGEDALSHCSRCKEDETFASRMASAGILQRGGRACSRPWIVRSARRRGPRKIQVRSARPGRATWRTLGLRDVTSSIVRNASGRSKIECPESIPRGLPESVLSNPPETGKRLLFACILAIESGHNEPCAGCSLSKGARRITWLQVLRPGGKCRLDENSEVLGPLRKVF